MEEKDIEEAVWEILESILLTQRTKMKLSDDLVRDLKIDSDDLSFIFVPELEAKLKVRIPVKEWGNVGTIQETIDILKKYKIEKQV